MHGYLKHFFDVGLDWAPYVVSGLVNAVLVFLGVVMSLPDFAEKIEKRYKKVFAGGCIVLGALGFFFDVVERHNSDKQTRQLVGNVDDMVQKTTKLVDNTNQMMSTLVGLVPQIAAINGRVASIDASLAEKKDNPAATAALEAERKQALSKLVALTPGIVGQLKMLGQQCYDDDTHLEPNLGMGDEQHRTEVAMQRLRLKKWCWQQARPLMLSANYVRKELLSRMPGGGQTDKDKSEEAVFARVVAGEEDDIAVDEILHAADYVYQLALKFNPNLPPLPPGKVPLP
jgi:hypothetical protein